MKFFIPLHSILPLMIFTFVAFTAEAAVSGKMIDNVTKVNYFGTISWDASNNDYVVQSVDKSTKISRSRSRVSLDIERPPQLNDANWDLLRERNENVITALKPLLREYAMLQHDEEIASLLATAYLNGNNFDEAVKVCESVIANKEEAAYKGKMFLTYWRILLAQNNTGLLKELLNKARLPDGTFAPDYWDMLKILGDTDSLKKSIRKAQTSKFPIPPQFQNIAREMAIADKQKEEAIKKSKEQERIAELGKRRIKYDDDILPQKENFNSQRQNLAATLEKNVARYEDKYTGDGYFPGITASREVLQSIKLSNSREIHMSYYDKTADLQTIVEQHNKQLREINTQERESAKIIKTTQEYVDFLDAEMKFFTLAKNFDVAGKIHNEIVSLKRTVNLQAPKQPEPQKAEPKKPDMALKLPNDKHENVYSLFTCPVDNREVKLYGFYADGTFICANYTFKQSVNDKWIAGYFNKYKADITKGTYKIQGSEIYFSDYYKRAGTIANTPSAYSTASRASAPKGELSSPTLMRINDDSYYFRGIVKNGEITY